MTPKQHGAHCAKLGYSIHYNPYRHKGSPEQYAEWEASWLSFEQNPECNIMHCQNLTKNKRSNEE